MSFLPHGTVYGTLLNSQGEWDALRAQMDQPPYKSPPKAPVLYVKPANTWSAHGASIPVPAHVPQVEVGATIAMVVSWTLIGYGRAVAWEMPIMGADFTLWRIVISLPMPILAGALGRVVYVRVRHRFKL